MEGKISIVSVEKNVDDDVFRSFFRKAETHTVNTALSFAAIRLELERWSRFNYKGAETVGNVVNPHDVLFDVMQNMGDVGPGFVASAVGYLAIDALCAPIEISTKKRIPEQAKIAAAVLIGIGVIFAHEKGQFISGSTDKGDGKDIILGILGPVAFAGTQYLVKNLVERIDDRIMQLKYPSKDASGVK